MNESNVERAMKYTHIQWTKEEVDNLNKMFCNLDDMIRCFEVQGDKEKSNALAMAYMNIHDITLDMGLRDMVADIKREHGIK